MKAPDVSPEAIYRRRFFDAAFRERMWQVLCREFFQQYIPEGSAVLEIAAGYCEFINHIRAAEKIAVDINPETARRAAPGVRVLLTPSTDLSALPDGSVDVAFTSNFFEHIRRPEIAATVLECRRVLRPGGRLLILQPNIRYAARDYWMFWDHITPIDDRALVELLEVCGFRLLRVLPRFLPYTTQGRLPRSIALLRLYLRLPFLQRIFGGQAFLAAEKVAPGSAGPGSGEARPA